MLGGSDPQFGRIRAFADAASQCRIGPLIAVFYAQQGMSFVVEAQIGAL